jgi:hypothetical protein
MKPPESKTRKPPDDYAISRLHYASSKLIVVDLTRGRFPKDTANGRKRNTARFGAMVECPRGFFDSCSARIAGSIGIGPKANIRPNGSSAINIFILNR